MTAMAPYTYIQCPCSDPSTLGRTSEGASPGAHAEREPNDDEDDDKTFDPRAPRSNYSLYPLEHLLYCEDCHQIRCPRCVAEEIVTYYCPSCLFEVPSSNIKSEGNRCTRSCFQCPICVGPLSVTSLESTSSSSRLTAEGAASPSGGPYILTCSYCNWSSGEIGIRFDKPNGIYSQLQKLRNGGQPRLTPKERKERRKDSIAKPKESSGISAAEEDLLDLETHYANLKSFYQSQLAETEGRGSAGLSSLGDLGFSSPGSLSRIMSLYTGGGMADKRHKARIGTMREALDSDEGLNVLRTACDGAGHDEGTGRSDGHGSSSDRGKPPAGGTRERRNNRLDESAAISKLRELGWEGTTTAEQRSTQAPNLGACGPHGGAAVRFQDHLRPIPVLLRTKRSKRCPICRHIMTKPESKVSSNRFRIRLVAGSYIPSISVRYLSGGSSGGAAGATAPAAAPGPKPDLLRPLEPVQYLLTFKNPIFEPVRVSLATPAATPGRFASTVTLLCPQFEIGANTDVWDEALKDGGGADGQRRQRRGADTNADGGSSTTTGKIWGSGRNWVSIVVEVVPASLRLDLLGVGQPSEQVDKSPLREDEDLLEIPMFVRVEWEADPTNEAVGHAIGKEKDTREKRELAYWCVIGIGRINQE